MTQPSKGLEKEFLPCHHCNKQLRVGTVINHYRTEHPLVYARIIEGIGN